MADKDIENIVSQQRYLIFHGEDQLDRGRLLGLENGQVLIGTDESSARRVSVNEIEIGVSEASYEASFWTRMHTEKKMNGHFSNLLWELAMSMRILVILAPIPS